MGVFQDETFADALKLALAAGMLSYMTPCAFPGQLPIFLLTPSTPCDIMNPTTTKPLTILDPYLSTPGSTKTLRPSYVAIPLYTIIPLPTIQVQGPPPQSTLSPHLLGSAFWDVVGRTLAYSVHGAAVLACVLSAVSEAASQKEPTFLRDDRQLPSCDEFDLDFLPPTPPEDDLLRVDIAGLESIPSSELYLGEEDLMTATPFPSKSQRPRIPRSCSSDATLVTLLESYLPSEDISTLMRMPDNELYFTPEHLGGLGTASLSHTTHLRSLPLRYRWSYPS